MRAGGCTVQQALTAEAATVVKQSVNLAKRRGHAQVTPLHVASMMLSSASLLRAACLQSHSHPLQCKALELCFNVALNRLPTSSTILAAHASPHHHFPTLSNALIAAFKRAQAHQRRGGVECQQQPLLTVKIELGQLIISILDDPSVSRVMREAGFSSTQVKIHVETAVMVEAATSAPDKSTNSTSGNKSKDANFAHGNKVMGHVRSEDVARVLNCFSSGNTKSVIVVGECVSLSQGVIKVVMDKIAKGEVQEDLRNTQLIPLPLSSSNIMTRDEVDGKVTELKSLVKSCCLGRRGALFVIEDFKWACEVWQFICQEKPIRGCANYTYSPVEHMIMEISSLIKSTGNARVWLLGSCTSSSYMSCKQGEPSLETLWCLHSIAVTDTGGLGLSLCESDIQIQRKSNGCNEDGSCRWSFSEGIHGNHTGRSVECHTNDQIDIPVWLQHNTREKKTGSNLLGPLEQNDFRLMNWNAVNDASFDSRNLNSSSELTLSFSNTLCPSLQANATTLHHDTRRPWPFSLEKERSCRGRGGHFWQTETNAVHGQCIMCLHNSNPNSTTNSSVSDETSNKEDYRPRFKELNAENLKILCNALESKVPWQKAIVPEIASAILQCRSGMKRRKVCRGSSGIREDTWFLFHGVDDEGKECIAREIASLVFGSQNQFVSMRLGTFVSTTRCTSPDNTITKRSRIDQHEVDYLEQVFRILYQNPRRVIFIKDIDQLDYNRKMHLARAIRDGVIRNTKGEEVSFHDSIVILSCDALFLRSHSSSPHANISKVDHEEHVKVANANEAGPAGFSLDLNLCVNDNAEECCFDDVGLLEVVDQVFCFKLQEIL